MISSFYLIKKRINRQLESVSFGIPRLLLFVFFGLVSLGFAQTDAAGWDNPENMSSSGSATEPQVLVDAAGVAHLIWQDSAVNSFVYTSRGPEGWSANRPVELPFGSREFVTDLAATDPTPLYNPRMVADTAGNIHAFWLGNENALFYSWVPAAQFEELAAWAQPQLLVAAAIGLSAVVDESGGVHLSYVRTQPRESLPAGIYYQKLSSVDEGWTEPTLLYPSQYFHGLPETQANTQLTVNSVGENSHVYIAWENRPLEKLFFARSVDGGLSWEESTIIDERQKEDAPNTVGPNNLTMTVVDESILLIWQAGHGLNSCGQYYQRSEDNGDSWQAPKRMLEELLGCPEGNRFLGVAGDFDLHFFRYEDQPYLMAWQDGRWSDPQIQPELSSFYSSETFRRVELGCLQLTLFDESQLLAVGCGTSLNEHADDIWRLSRPVGDIETWYPTAPTWEEPKEIITGGLNLLPPIMAADSQGKMHVIWSQADDTNRSQNTIYYAFLDEGQWTQAVPVIQAPEGDIGQLEMIISEDDQLMVIWVSNSGKLFFSRSNVENAMLQDEWSSPLNLLSPKSFISGADIAVSDDGNVYVATSIPVNNRRGVYLQESLTGGSSWSDPILALDGGTNFWEIVGPPRLEVTSDGQIHLLVVEQAPQAAGLGLATTGLFYSRSNSIDGEFSQPELVSEKAVNWADLMDDGRQIIHRLWQEPDGLLKDVRHEYSVDAGQTWSESTRVTNQQGPVGFAVDSGGQVHAVQISDGAMNHRIWNGEGWQIADDSGSMRDTTALPGVPQSVVLALSPKQILAALFTNEDFAAEPSEPLSNAYLTWGTIGSPAELSVSLPTPAPTAIPLIATVPVEKTPSPDPVPSVTITATSETVAQPETTGNTGLENSSLIESDNSIVRTVTAFLPAALFLVIIFSVGVLIVRRGLR